MPPQKGTKSTKGLKQKTLTGFFSSSPAPPTPVTPPRKAKARPKRKRAPSPTPASTRPAVDEDEGRSDSDVAAIRFEPEVALLSDDESPRPPRAKKRTRLAPARSISSSGKAASSPSVIDLSDEDIVPKRRKFVKGVRPPSPTDDDDISDGLDEDKIIDTRLRTRDKKTAFQKNLEKLKRKKHGQPALQSSESEEIEDEEYNVEPVPFAGARPHRDSDLDLDSVSSREEDPVEDDSWIVEDDSTASAAQLPAQFSMNSHQELIHHFKVICQLFVHLAVRPRAERRAFMKQTMKNEEYFSVPLQIARRKIDGLRDSLVVSSVWRPEFKKPLETYPELEVFTMDAAVPACDACHLGGRVSTRLGRVSGRPYDHLTYEPLDEPDASDSEDSDEKDTTTKEFHLGRFCAVRTQTFHKFMHWEYNLYTALAQQIAQARGNDSGRTYVRVAFVNGVQPPKDPDDADGYMDWLDQRGIIDFEWQNVKSMMNQARNLDMMSKRGDNDMD
ncbi:hypothetical protein PLICRDRAFT_54305 [Plicaturopsis crispa FD-325 SS-3]|nr:hypothetical protein PLICRDRAFT_54305 [Plicaturopsis crispa FD-325 SS-3]